MMKSISIMALTLLLTATVPYGCSDDSGANTDRTPVSPGPTGDVRSDRPEPVPDPQTGWLVASEEVVSGGVGPDAIPALEYPRMEPFAQQASYLTDDSLVLGIVIGDEARAYPHTVLDRHEIINDTIGDTAFAVTYCPLTGSGIGINRTISGETTTFGVSGLLYNSNLICYDRATFSYWSQMKMLGINGERQSLEFEPVTLVETTWATWREMYPRTKAVSEDTGFSFSYGLYPYGNYRTSSEIMFPVSHEDFRLFAKDRIHGIITPSETAAVNVEDLPDDITVLHHTVGGIDLVTVGSNDLYFAATYRRTVDDGVQLEFEAVEDALPVIMRDKETGSSWDVFGQCLRGPRQGQSLGRVTTYNAYWFAWAAFHPETRIVSMEQ